MTTHAEEPPGPLRRAGARPALVVPVLLMGVMTYSMALALLVPALPLAARVLHTGTAGATWGVTVLTLSAAVVTPVAGRLGDVRGRRRVLLAVLLVTAAGLLICLAAPNLPIFLVGRALAGFAGATFPLVFAIVRDVLPADRVASGIGLLSSALGIGSAAGWVLAGPLADHVGWWSLSALPLLLSVLGCVGVAAVVPRDPARPAAGREPIDVVGAALLALWLVLLLVGVSEGGERGWTAAPVLTLLAGGLVLAVVWGVHELTRTHPLVDLRLHRSGDLLTANAAALVAGFALMAAGVLVPVLVQLPRTPGGVGLGGSATAAALSQLPAALAMIPAGPLAGRLGRSLTPRFPLALGAGLVVVAYVFGAFAHTHLWQLWVLNGVRGLGVGLVYAAMSTLAALAVAPGRTGAASGGNTLVRNLGVAIGSQVTVSIHAAGGDTHASYAVAFLVPALLAAVILAIVLHQLGPVSRQLTGPGVTAVPGSA